jgi:hypothetical protein
VCVCVCVALRDSRDPTAVIAAKPGFYAHFLVYLRQNI